jgi:hypothetical protein
MFRACAERSHTATLREPKSKVAHNIPYAHCTQTMARTNRTRRRYCSILVFLVVFLIRIFPCRSPDAAFTRPSRSSTSQTGAASASGACCDHAQPTHTPACVFTVQEIHPAGRPHCSVHEHAPWQTKTAFAWCLPWYLVRQTNEGRGKERRGGGRKAEELKTTGPKEPP